MADRSNRRGRGQSKPTEEREALVRLTALLFLLIWRIVPSNRMIARTTAYDVLPVVRIYLDCQNCGIR